VRPRLRAAAAGAIAATAWALGEPVDRRLFRCPASDVALLGKLLTRRDRAWLPLGLGLHALNGALAGIAFEALDRRLGGGTRRNALLLALGEHVATYPLTILTDRLHPARGTAGVPPLARSPRAFAQATYRHALFGLVLGSLLAPERRPRLRAGRAR
jgi:hypothetical protein